MGAAQLYTQGLGLTGKPELFRFPTITLSNFYRKKTIHTIRIIMQGSEGPRSFMNPLDLTLRSQQLWNAQNLGKKRALNECAQLETARPQHLMDNVPTSFEEECGLYGAAIAVMIMKDLLKHFGCRTCRPGTIVFVDVWAEYVCQAKPPRTWWIDDTKSKLKTPLLHLTSASSGLSKWPRLKIN